MRVKLVCDYCHCEDQKDLYMITLTGIKDTKNTCSKIICSKCAEHLGMTLDAILNKRDLDDALKEIENDLLEED